MSVYEINYNNSLPDVELSILTPSRSKNNLSSGLKKLLDSVMEFSTPEELSKLEWIFKFDDDCEIPSFLNDYPFRIKFTQYARGTGRWGINEVQTFLSRLRKPESRFVLTLSDDFVVKRPFINEVLSIENEYVIIGGATRGRGEQKGGDAMPFLDDDITIPLGGDWRNLNGYRHCIAHYAMMCSSKVLDSMVAFGFIPSNDLCFLAVAMCIYKEFGVNIWHDMTSFYYRNESKAYYPSVIPVYHTEVANQKYNVLDIIQLHNSPYANNYWKLIYQSAKNIYLNMKYDNVI
jgi:hypothetical protein